MYQTLLILVFFLNIFFPSNLFSSSDLFTNSNKGVMCERLQNKTTDRLDTSNGFEYFIMNKKESDNPKKLDIENAFDSPETVKVFRKTMCGWDKVDAKITALGLLFYSDVFGGCHIDGNCRPILRGMYMFNKDSNSLQGLFSSNFDKSTPQNLSLKKIFKDIGSYTRSSAEYECEIKSPKYILDFVEENTYEGLGEWDKEMGDAINTSDILEPEYSKITAKEFYCPANLLSKQNQFKKEIKKMN